MRSIQVITEPSFEPVTLDEAKLWCRIEDDSTDEDAIVLMLVKAMREHAEAKTGRAFVQRTLEVRYDEFPADPVIELPYAPVQSITSIQYIDTAGTLQSLEQSPSGWQEDLSSEPARIAPLVGTSWPNTLADQLGAVRVTYIAGYARQNLIPKALRLWIEARIATLFENREQLVTGGVISLPRDFVDAMLDHLIVHKRFA